ncbi:MAG TPA: molybdenum cofactor guanylyltransferase [Pyrinomonadaceae bacterium]
MQLIEGFILSGGQSRRMGRDKCELTLNGRTFVELISEQMSPITRSAKMVGRPVTQSNLSQVADVYPAWGALGGVHAALANCSSEWALVVACDFPFVTTELFRKMDAVSEGFDAVAPIQADGVPQPLCTLYRVDPCLAQAEQLIKSSERKPIALLQSVRTRWIAFEELEALEGSTSFFNNINTPEDYDQIQRKGTDASAK